MTQNLTDLHDLIKTRAHTEHATDAGRRMHAKLQRIVIDGNAARGDAELVSRIKSCGTLAEFFAPNSRTEVPVAGYINDRFISRRIDRMRIDHDARRIDILDYKTDISRDALQEKYARQLGEYRELMGRIYPGYEIRTYILWTHFWELERVD